MRYNLLLATLLLFGVGVLLSLSFSYKKKVSASGGGLNNMAKFKPRGRRTPSDGNLDFSYCTPFFPKGPVANPDKLSFCKEVRFSCNNEKDLSCSCFQGHQEAWSPFAKEVVDPQQHQARVNTLSNLISAWKYSSPIITTISVDSFTLPLLLNWACSVRANKIANYTSLFPNILVLACDAESHKGAVEAGFQTVLLTEYYKSINALKSTLFKQKKGPKESLGVVLKFLLAGDLLQMGKDVVVQDPQVVWNRDPTAWLAENDFFDLQVMHDNRIDSNGPATSSFVYLKHGCRTNIFVQTYLSQLWGTMVETEQGVFNAVLMNPTFRGVNVNFLPRKYFINTATAATTTISTTTTSTSKTAPTKPKGKHNKWHYIVRTPGGGDGDHVASELQVNDGWFFRPECKLYAKDLDPLLATQ